jgi:hypothetical protein
MKFGIVLILLCALSLPATAEVIRLNCIKDGATAGAFYEIDTSAHTAKIRGHGEWIAQDDVSITDEEISFTHDVGDNRLPGYVDTMKINRVTGRYTFHGVTWTEHASRYYISGQCKKIEGTAF